MATNIITRKFIYPEGNETKNAYISCGNSRDRITLTVEDDSGAQKKFTIMQSGIYLYDTTFGKDVLEFINGSPVQLTLSSGVSSAEASNCNYCICGNIVFVNLAALTASPGQIASGLPKSACRSNVIIGSTILYINANDTTLNCSDVLTSAYAFLEYPIAL